MPIDFDKLKLMFSAKTPLHVCQPGLRRFLSRLFSLIGTYLT
jgi:hypothetical protein